MSKDIDFILSDIAKIERPSKNQPPKKSTKSFQISKSFAPTPKSQIHQHLRPEVEKLKNFLKVKKQRERKMKQKLAEGLITKQEYEGKQDGNQNNEKNQENEIKEKYVIDQSGQLRDKEGNLIYVKSQTTSLIINKKMENQQISKDLNKKQKIKFHDKLTKNLRDRNLVVGSNKKRIRRSMLGFQFLEKGSYQSYSMKQKKQITNLEDILVKKQEEQPRVIRKRQRTKLQFNRDVPICQWWDRQILKPEYFQKFQRNLEVKKQQQSPQNINDEFVNYLDINKLCEEVTYQRVGDQKKENKVSLPVYLTKDERKKLKRKRKKEKLLQKNDMVKLGLIEPEKVKLKVSNMAIVKKDQFIIDPSRVEAEARKQEQERLKQHLNANQERKLSKNQRKEKVIRKLKKDSAKETKRIVFKLYKLENTQHIFKVNMNAKQLALNGFILKPNQFHRQPVLVFAEGGQKAIKFFKNLMLNRIKWSEDEGNSCKLLWEGQIQNSTIGKWRTYEVGDESQTVKTLTEKNVQNFSQYLY